jgi:hypothetical protein
MYIFTVCLENLVLHHFSKIKSQLAFGKLCVLPSHATTHLTACFCVLSMSGLPSFDLSPGYQFNPSSLLFTLSSADPALTLLAPEQLKTLELTFELILMLIQPSRCVCTLNRKQKK